MADIMVNIPLPNGNVIIVERWYRPFESRGVMGLAIAAAISLVSVTALLIIMSISGWRALRNADDSHSFIRRHVAAYFVSLLFSDLVASIGSLMNTRWVSQNHVSIGMLCSAQGAIKQAGNVGAALWSLVIAIHTFRLLFLQQRPTDWACVVTIIGVWGFIVFIVIIGPLAVESPDVGDYFGISGLWCWITDDYPVYRFFFEYFFMFLSAGLSILLYTLMFFRLRGNIQGFGWKMRFGRVPNAWKEGNVVETQIMKIGKQMLWYPVIYTVSILPIAACRWSEFFGHPVPFEATIFSGTVFMLSGFFNAVLFVTTRPIIPLPTFLRSRISDSALESGLASKTCPPISFVSSQYPRTSNLSSGTDDSRKEILKAGCRYPSLEEKALPPLPTGQ